MESARIKCPLLAGGDNTERSKIKFPSMLVGEDNLKVKQEFKKAGELKIAKNRGI